MRYIVFGAGAIGGMIGGRLHQNGRDVTLIARGAHLEALRRDGLCLRLPDGDVWLRPPAVESPHGLASGPETVVVLAVKSQDTQAAVEVLAECCCVDTPIVCAQNGVENERLALRCFRHVYGMCVAMPTTHVLPGVIQGHQGQRVGSLDLGRYPTGVDETAVAVARDLEAAGFNALARADVMRWKYGKLLANLANALEVLSGPEARGSDLFERARAEAIACYRAAGIEWAFDPQRSGRRDALMGGGRDRRSGYVGGSTWQSLIRGAARLEVDHLNGEIVLLGRTYGVPTPVNESLQRAVQRLCRERRPAGSVPLEQLRAEIAGA